MVLIQSRVEIAVLPAVTAILLHHFAMDTWIDCNVVSTVKEGKWRFCLQLLQYCYITVQWIHGLTLMLLVQVRGGNGCSACSYCSNVTSQCYGYMD